MIFFTGHIICAYVCRIYHSSLLRYCLLCARFQPFIVSKLNAELSPAAMSPAAMLLLRSACAAAQWRRSVAPLSAILWSPSTGLVCHSPEMNWESSGIVPNSHIKTNGSDISDLIYASDQCRTNTMWSELMIAGPLGPQSGFLYPLARLARLTRLARLARRVKKHADACANSILWTYEKWKKICINLTPPTTPCCPRICGKRAPTWGKTDPRRFLSHTFPWLYI